MKVRSLVRLDPVGLHEDNDLGALIDGLQQDDPELRRLRRRILGLQRKLRARVDDQTWQVYLGLEEAMNERGSRLLSLMSERLRRRARS